MLLKIVIISKWQLIIERLQKNLEFDNLGKKKTEKPGVSEILKNPGIPNKNR